MKKLFKGGFIYSTADKKFIKKDILTDGDVITEIEDDINVTGIDVVSINGYLIPGMVDIHTHGRGGYDFNTAQPKDYDNIALSYARAGTTSVMPTLASAPLDMLEESVYSISNYENKGGYSHFLGTHLEGRYLSPIRRGAHAAELLYPPSVSEIRKFKGIAKNSLIRLSLAPELDGADEMIKEAVKLGVTVSAAHTDATYDCLMNALSLGVTGFTHTYNCMKPLHHREAGGVGASLASDNAFSEFICDGFHISKDVIRLSYRAKDKEHFILVTDSMEAAGCDDGEYSIGGLPVFVRDGKAVNAEGAIAGSTLDLFTAMHNLMKFCNITVEDALPHATSLPAKAVGAFGECGSIDVGKRADFIEIKDKLSPALSRVFAAGCEVL